MHVLRGNADQAVLLLRWQSLLRLIATWISVAAILRAINIRRWTPLLLKLESNLSTIVHELEPATLQRESTATDRWV